MRLYLKYTIVSFYNKIYNNNNLNKIVDKRNQEIANQTKLIGINLLFPLNHDD